MIVAGGGVRASGAAAELVALAEALQIPVATSLNGKDSIPGTHPLSVGVVGTYSRESANRVVNRADLVCFIGTETGGMTTHFWAVPKIGTPAIQIDIDAGGARPQLSAAGGRQRRRQGDARAHAASAPIAAAPARRKAWVARGAGDLPRVVREVQRRCSTSDAVPIRPERICGELTQARAGRRHRGGRHRPRRHVDGRHVRPAQPAPELHAQRRPSRLGVLGRPRRQVRVPGAAGGDVHRRRRLLVPHRRDRDRGALEDQRRHGRQQQRRRQPVASAASTASMAASRPSRRASCGPSTR